MSVGIAFLLGCSGYSKTAEKPTVVILSVKGKKAKAVRGDMVDLIRDQNYPLVKRKAYDKTARRLKAKRIKAKNVRKVATQIGANAVITGRLKRRGKRKYVLTVTVRDGATGKRVDRFDLKLKKRKLTDDDRSRLQDMLVASLSLIEVPEPEPEADEDEDEDDDDDGEKVAAKSKKNKKKSKKQRAREEKERLRAAVEERKQKEREAKEAKREERERKRAEAREKKMSKREKKKRERELAKKEKARKKKERERKRREKEKEDELPPVDLPSVGNDGQAIDDEMPGGL